MIGLSNPYGAITVIKLVQGDASIIGEIYSRLGWSGNERSYYASLACLVNQNPFVSEFRSRDNNAWMAFKHLPSIVSNLAELFKLPGKGIELLIKAARRDTSTIAWLRQNFGFETFREAQRFIDGFVFEDDPDNDFFSDSEKSESEDSSSMMDSSSQGSFTSSEGPDEIDEENAPIKKKLTLSLDPKIKAKMMNDLIAFLNGKSQQGEGYFNEDLVKLVLALAGGNLAKIDELKDYLKTIHKDLPIDINTAKEIMALSTGD